MTRGVRASAQIITSTQASMVETTELMKQSVREVFVPAVQRAVPPARGLPCALQEAGQHFVRGQGRGSRGQYDVLLVHSLPLRGRVGRGGIMGSVVEHFGKTWEAGRKGPRGWQKEDAF